MRKRWMHAGILAGGVLFGALTACGGTGGPSLPGDDPGAGGGVVLSGTVHAPAGGDVAGTLVVACLPLGDGCDEARSHAHTVTEAGASAAFEIGGLEAVDYLLLAVKDGDENGSFEDAGDLHGLFGSDGRVTAPARGLELRLAAGGAGLPLPRPQPQPEPRPDPDADAYSVRGRAVDTLGRPIPGALVRVVPTHTSGQIEVRTDADGEYRVDGLLDLPYVIRAFHSVERDGRAYCLRLGHPDLAHYDAFVPRNGAVRDFRWQLQGPVPDRPDAHFGGTFVAYQVDAWAEHGRALEFAFAATGPRLDGSPGESFVYLHEFNGWSTLAIKNIPVSDYTLTVALVGFDESRTPLRMGPESFGPKAASMEIVWEGNGCSLEEPVSDEYAFVAVPGE